jgi:hypothetical protein
METRPGHQLEDLSSLLAGLRHVEADVEVGGHVEVVDVRDRVVVDR